MLEQAHTLFDLESNFFGAYWLLGWAHWCQGNHEAAIADLRKAVTLGGGPIPLADLGCLLGQSGRKAEAQQVLEDLGEIGKRAYVQPAYFGFVHAGLGNHDEAFACFARGLEDENASVAWIREYCIFASLDRFVPIHDSRRCLKKSEYKDQRASEARCDYVDWRHQL